MIPEGWLISTLEKFIDIKHGFAFKSDYFRSEGEYILTTPGHFFEVGGFRDQGNKTKYYVGEVPKGYILKKGDVLLAMTEQTAGLLGSAIYVPEPGKYLHNQRLGLVLVRDHERICKEYIYLIYNSPTTRKTIAEQASGTKVKHTSPSRLLGVKVLIPPLSEQKKIAQILSAWDKAITTTEQLLTNSQQQKKALMQQLLTGKKRFEGFHQAWSKIKVSKMGSISSGGTPDTTEKEYWGGSISWLTPSDVTSLKSRYVFSTNKAISEKGLKNSSAKMLPKGTLLICTRATIGAMAISTTEITTNQGFKNLVPNPYFSVEFLYYLFIFNVKELVRNSSGSTFLELSKKDFEKLTFLCPRLDEQHKIASVLIAVDNVINVQQQKLDYLKQEKQALMQQLLTGKRRVKTEAV